MRQQFAPTEVLDRAVTVLRATTGLRAEWSGGAEAGNGHDLQLNVDVSGIPIAFLVELKSIDRFETLHAIKKKSASAQHRTLLIAPYVTQAIADRCRELEISFIDEAGNMHLEGPGLFVHRTGRPRPVQAAPKSTFRALTPSGLRIVFALLNEPHLTDAPYRDIAKAANTALGTVGPVLADLQARGHLTPDNHGPRRLLALDRLRKEWATHYPIKLRAKLNARRFTAPQSDWWRSQELGQYDAFWGGEVAADKLTGHLKPASITLYVDGKADRLILANRLRPDVNGEIEILDAFWRPQDGEHTDIAPPLLVYADLMRTHDSRNIETAKLIHDRYFT
jgi:hypothetical protein